MRDVCGYGVLFGVGGHCVFWLSLSRWPLAVLDNTRWPATRSWTGGFFMRCYNAAMSNTIKYLPLIGLAAGFIGGMAANSSPDPFNGLLYGGIGGVIGTCIGLVVRFGFAKTR